MSADSVRPIGPNGPIMEVPASAEPHLIQQPRTTRQTLVFDDYHTVAELYGQGDRTLRILEQELGIDVHARGNEVRLLGSEAGVATAKKVATKPF